METPPRKHKINAAVAGKFAVNRAVAHHEAVRRGIRCAQIPIISADTDECIGIGLCNAMVKRGDKIKILHDTRIAERAQAAIMGLIGCNG